MNIKTRVSIDKSDLLFYVAYIMYFVSKYSEYTTINCEIIVTIFYLLKNLSYVICAFEVFLRLVKCYRVNLHKAILHTFLLTLIAYQVEFNDGKELFVVLLFSYGFANRNLRDFIKVSYVVSVILFFSTIAFSFLSITDNVRVAIDKFGMVWYRQSLGFIYPGQLAMFVLALCFMHFYLNYSKINIYTSVMWILIFAVAFLICSTIMPTMEGLLFIMCMLFFRSMAKCKHIYLCIPFLGITTYFILFMQFKGSRIANIIDKITTDRFTLGCRAIKQYGITLWGTGFKNITEGNVYLVLDSDYIFMLISKGIIYTIILILIYMTIVKWAIKAEEYIIVWILLFWAMHAMFNNGMINLLMNPFVIVLGNVVNELTSKSFLKLNIKLVTMLRFRKSFVKVK